MKSNGPRPERKALAGLHGLRVRSEPPAAVASCACGFWAADTGTQGTCAVVAAYEAHRATCRPQVGQEPTTAPAASQMDAEDLGRAA
jgi:hypothetical protein